MLIRKIKPEDAENFICLIKRVESEANFMLMEAGERKTTTDQQRKQLERIEQQSNSTIFVAEQEQGKLVGYLIAIGGSVRRTKHSAYLVIGILEEYRGRGIGTSLPFVYHLDCRNTRKCYSDLFKYINENLSKGESIELYTCLDGDELKEKNDILNVVVNLKIKHFINDIGNFMLNEKRLFDDLTERFSFRERQYVVVTK